MKKNIVQLIIGCILIGFNGLLIYGLLFGEKVPFFISCVLVLMIIILALATWGYFITIFSSKEKLEEIERKNNEARYQAARRVAEMKNRRRK